MNAARAPLRKRLCYLSDSHLAEWNCWVEINGEAPRTLGQFLRMLRRQRRELIGKLKKKTIDMGDAIEAVAQAAGERKAGATIAVVQRAITTLAEGASVERAASAVPAVVPVTTTKPGSAEDKCRRVWRTGMSAPQLAAAAKVSPSTAKRWRAKFIEQEQLFGIPQPATKRR